MVQTVTARLVVLPPYRGAKSQVALNRSRLLIGRDPDNDLVLDGPGVSRRHAEVSRSNGRWTVRDLGSTNGTSLGQQRVTHPVEIRDGDVLLLGDVGIRMENPHSARTGAPPTAVLRAGR